jgi:predicted RNA binding protein YcfA (HicA-like mRNA interferase family)
MGIVYSFKEIVDIIKKDGWYLVEEEGSHCQYKHPVKKGKITVPKHNRDLAKGTANSILKQAGLK